jgi:HEAT repeat protein
MGADATEVLLGLLTTAESATMRRGYYNALTQMKEGASLLIHMLSHDEWYVVRNAADLCGELKLEESVPHLAKRITHSDERVRKSVAGALAKIGTAATIEPLRNALKDASPMVRLHAASHIDGKKGRGLAMTLAVGVEQDSSPEVQREMLLALGRIGSQEAIQALTKAAEPGGKIFKRKPTALRLAAVEGLQLAGPPAANALKHLLADDDAEVREAAQKAFDAKA